MSNRTVICKAPGKVAVESIPDPKFETPVGPKITHGVIIKVVATNICGSVKHVVRGPTAAEAGLLLAACCSKKMGEGQELEKSE